MFRAELKGCPEMVIDEVRVIDEERRSARAGAFAKQCALSKMEGSRTEKTQLAKRCSYEAIVNQVPPQIDLSSYPNQLVLQRFTR